jgi:hypothetical protein
MSVKVSPVISRTIGLVDFKNKSGGVICSLWVEEFQNEFAQGYCGRASDDFWGWGRANRQKRKSSQLTHDPNKQRTTAEQRSNNNA